MGTRTARSKVEQVVRFTKAALVLGTRGSSTPRCQKSAAVTGCFYSGKVRIGGALRCGECTSAAKDAGPSWIPREKGGSWQGKKLRHYCHLKWLPAAQQLIDQLLEQAKEQRSKDPKVATNELPIPDPASSASTSKRTPTSEKSGFVPDSDVWRDPGSGNSCFRIFLP